MRMIFLGPPGAGKGTQAQRIQEKTSIPLLVMGDMLRESVENADAVGREAKGYMDRGELVPDQVVIQVILQRLLQKDCQSKGFMLDGFPRTQEQAIALGEHLTKENLNLDLVVYYSLPDEVLIERISGRKICRKCNRIFNSKNAFSCPTNTCQGEHLFQRKDDDPQVLPKRLEVYHEKTAPLLAYYKQLNLLQEISANRDVHEVLKETLSIIQRFSK